MPEETGLTRKPHTIAYSSENDALCALLEEARGNEDFLCTVLLNEDIPELLVNT